MAAITTEQLIQLLEQGGLVPAELIDEIRAQSARKPENATPRRIVRWLVKNGHLSGFQAQELLSGPSAGDELDVIDDLEELDELEAIDDLEPIDQPGPPGLPAAPAGMIDPSLMQAAGVGPTMTPGGTLGIPAGGKKKTATSPWENWKFLGGAGLLVLLVVTAVVLFLTIKRGTGDEAFGAAEKDYGDGRYSAAISKYNRYLEDFPDHGKVSLAKVRVGLCQMRISVDAARDEKFIKALDDVIKTTKRIRQEDAFGEARPELSVMLHNIAEGLVEYAEAKPNETTVKRCKETVRMCQNSKYVPPKHRDTKRLARVLSRLERVEIDLDRVEQLREAVRAITQHVEKGTADQIAECYRIHKKLVKRYPGIEETAELRKAILSASQAERRIVKFVDKPVKALPSEPKDPVKTTVLVTPTVTGKPPGVDGRVVFALAEGALFALDAAGGDVLWRRFVGYDTTASPVPLGADADSDMLVIDSKRGELVRLETKTGKLKWRLPLAGLKTAPLVFRDRALVSTNFGSTGRLYAINLETGATAGYVELPQRVLAPPAVDAEGRHVYQVGEHSNLYVISAADGKTCESVIYLGHDAGTVDAPPSLVSEFFILPQNSYARNAVLRVFRLGDGGTTASQLQEVRIDGHVHTPLVVAGVKVIASTDLGGVFIYDLSPANEKEPLVRGPQKSATRRRQMTYMHLRRNRLWVASSEFSSYEIDSAVGQLKSLRVDDQDDAFLQPLQVAGDVIFHVRRERNKPGVVVSAVNMTKYQRYWETRVAPPPAAGAVLDPARREVVVLLVDGSLYQVPLDDLNTDAVFSVVKASATVKQPPAAESQVVRLPKGRLVYASPHDREAVLAFDPAGSGPLLNWVSLPDVAGGPATAFGESLLVPGSIGQVFSFNPFDGGQMAGRTAISPFLPEVESGREYRWLASRQGRQRDVLLSEGERRLYRVGVRSQPTAHLAALSEAELEQPLDPGLPIARLERTAFAVTAAGGLAGFDLPSLNTGPVWPLRGRVAWGPRRVGQHVLVCVAVDPFDEVHMKSGKVVRTKPILASLPQKPRAGGKLAVRPLEAKTEAKESTDVNEEEEEEEEDKPTLIAWADIAHVERFGEIVKKRGAHRLMCVDEDQQVVFDVFTGRTRHGSLAGEPLAVDDGFVFASVDGTVWKLGLDGKEIAKTTVGQPLASGAIPLDENHLLFAGRDGTLHVVPML